MISGWYWRLAAYSARWDTPCVAVLPCTTPFIFSVPARLWRGRLLEWALCPPFTQWGHSHGSPNVTVKASCSDGSHLWYSRLLLRFILSSHSATVGWLDVSPFFF